MSTTKTEVIDYMKRSSLIVGSPESTYGKNMHDGSVESFGDYTRRSRKEINYHLLNGTDIPAILRSNVSGVVGSGINIQSRTGAKSIDTAMEDLLSEHGEVKNFEVTGRWHSNEAYRQMVYFVTLQGGIVIRHHHSTEWAIPYKIELVGIDMIDISKNIRQDNVQNGLKKDRWGKVVGIYLYNELEKRTSSLHSMENMDYIVTTWVSLSQYTAVSRLVTILQTIDATSQYTVSEVKAAIERAKNGVFWHTELYTTIMKELEKEFEKADVSGKEKIGEVKELMQVVAGKGVGINGATPTPPEDKITQIDNKTSTVFKTLKDESQKSMAAAMGGSQVSVYGDIEKGNYASIKAAISFDEEECKIVFNNLENYIIKPYLKRLFDIGVQIGRIPLARSKWVNNPRKYYKWDILRTSRRVINEKDDATATKTNLETGVTNLDIEYGKRGRDRFEDEEKKVDKDIEIELMKREKYNKAGLQYPKDKVVEPSSLEEEIDNKIEENQNKTDGEEK